MVLKFFLALNVLIFLSLPTGAMAQSGVLLYDQFKGIDLAVFQGTVLLEELVIESYRDTGSVQGLNVIKEYDKDGKVVQAALVEADLTLDLSHSDDTIQGLNVFQSDSKAKVAQIAIVEGTVTMKSNNSNGGIQGINIITGSMCN
jgi:hypothetical protein